MARLSIEHSAFVVNVIRSWMGRLGLRSVYELYLLTDVPRATLHRWLSGSVRLPIEGARHLARALGRRAGADEPRLEIDAALAADRVNSRMVLLAAECRARRVPFSRAVEAIRAANLRIVAVDDYTTKTN